ncbi:hypothetical protein GHT06_005059 [Daphnia sinensis]|uniref:Uncharacterized protein n=1 Tax=Daphnia sinensis TaxID=1820382 RepID=A0AAD5KEX9_9CRUS|nr:hypothetical protein GHT06_005059 [Daphnia sinensis]
MSFLNYIPGVAQAKANIHLIFNDKEGAARTLETYRTKTPIVAHLNAGIAKLFGDDETAKKCWDGGNSSLNALPVVGHVKGVGHYICGDIDGGDKAMVNATRTTLNMADGIPVVGHAKGVVHYVCGDVDGGNKAMKAATRTTAVMGAGAGGFLIAGPAGAVAGAVGVGANWDVIDAAVTDGEEINGIAEIIDNPKNVDAYFNAVLRTVCDGMAGYNGGKIAKDVVRRVGNKAPGGNAGAAAAAGEAEAAAAQQLFEDLDAGKITYNEYQQKWNAMKPKGGLDNVPVKVNKDQFWKRSTHYDKGSMTKKQYNQAKEEIAAAGGKNVTVNVPLNQEPTSDGASDGNQPPQKPTENKSSEPECRVSVLRQRLTELLNRIRQFISRVNGRQWSRADRQFRRESFRQMYDIVSELISNGHSVTIREDSYLVIYSRHDVWIKVIEYQLVDFFDVHDQLIGQQFRLFPTSCPTVLLAKFQGSELRLTEQWIHGFHTNVIYGIRCRLCRSKISYVGLTTRSVHDRVCGEHARSVANAITNNLYGGRAAPSRPMCEHAAYHYHNGDVPPGTQPRNVFRELMDVIILPIGPPPKKDEEAKKKKRVLRSWECFWQFFLHCRKFFWGWSHQ